MIDRAAILGNGVRLEVAKALGSSTSPYAPQPPGIPTLYEVIPEVTQPLLTPPAAAPGPVATLDAAMAQHIVRALAATSGRIEGRGGTADLLGINPHTLRARMRKLGLDWTRFRK